MNKDLTDKIDLLIEMARRQEATSQRQEATLQRQEATLQEHSLILREHGSMLRNHEKLLHHLDSRVESNTQAIAALGVRVESNTQAIVALTTSVAEIRGMLSERVPAADFYELRGRVEEISRRLPTTIGYTPPSPKSAAE